MHVMLINPPLPHSSPYTKELLTQPLGLAYIAAVLEKAGIPVNILDCPPLNYTHEDVKRFLEKEDPEVVGVTSTTLTIESALKTASVVREASPDARIYLGGPHVTFLDKETLMKAPYVDGVVRGEGEYTFLEIVERIRKGLSLRNVKGLTLLRNGSVFRFPERPLIKDLDSIPYPARHLLPLNRYKAFGMKCPSMSVLSSRGCPFRCKFCSVRRIFGNMFRARTSENILEELEELYEVYQTRYITFVDDIFTLDRRRTFEICRGITTSGLDIIWDCETRVDVLTKPLVDVMAEAGCQAIFFGVESGDQGILNAMGKGITTEQVRRAFKWAKEAGIKTIASVILFYPGENAHTIEKTVSFLKELDPDLAQFCIATPFPGTELYEEMVRNGLIQEIEEWSKFDVLNPVFALNGFTIEEMKKTWSKAYISFYLRPVYIAKRMIKKDWPTIRAFLYLLLKTLKSKFTR
ncbi:MAG: radical SAM protein [Candidatus Bathyarchaeia archaeon]